MNMQGIKKLLEKNPGLLRVSSLDQKKEGRYKYEQTLKYDKVNELAREYISWASSIPGWKVDAFIIEKIFNFGKGAAREYAINLSEIERLFNEVLPRYGRGGSLGFFISGLYENLIMEGDVLRLNLMNYPATISGLGYRHSYGSLEIIGDRAYYVGMEMEAGEIQVSGNVGNYLGKSMKGGRLIIDGNARNWIGEEMEGGFILISGGAGHIVGKKMTGGEIVIRGDAGYWIGDDATGGMIRVKAKETFYPVCDPR